ncbi:ADP-ribose glycohydrolase MACROD1-like isoform X2 [Halichondria panicea]|uniref:ADP-ribose glycohydrolase MACROD1-like isoform X2 n=1 Tax=Halichondria panicea TaxID=6063 RepID=UPI00312B9DE7
MSQCWRTCCVLRCFMSDNSSPSPSSTTPLLVSTPPRSRSNTPPGPVDASKQRDVLEGEGEGEKCPWTLITLAARPISWVRSLFTSATEVRDRAYWEGLLQDDKRKQYTCRGYVTLEDITPWQQQLDIQVTLRGPSRFAPDSTLNSKVSLWRGDITSLEIGAIVNAANSSLMGGGGVDGAIHRAASGSLKTECRSLRGGRAGETKITGGHRLPAQYILHTVGPTNRSRETLTNCYTSCFHLVKQKQIKSVAFCCIATGVYGYPNEDAAHVALATTREWLVHNADKVDRVIFCVFLEVDYRIYSRLLHDYFPREQLEAANEESSVDEVAIEEADFEEAAKKEAGVVVAANNEMDDPWPPPLNRSITEPTGTQSMITKETSVDSPQPMDTRNSCPTPDPTSDPTPDPKKQRTDQTD